MSAANRILGSVGYMAMNRFDDVRIVQRLLNEGHLRLCAAPLVKESGLMSPDTVAAIRSFQRQSGESESGRLDPQSRLLPALDRASRSGDVGDDHAAPGPSLIEGTIEILVSDGGFLSPSFQWEGVALDIAGIVYAYVGDGYGRLSRELFLARNQCRDTVGVTLRLSAFEVGAVRDAFERMASEPSLKASKRNRPWADLVDVLHSIGVVPRSAKLEWEPASRGEVSPKEVLIVVSRSARMQERNFYPARAERPERPARRLVLGP